MTLEQGRANDYAWNRIEIRRIHTLAGHVVNTLRHYDCPEEVVLQILGIIDVCDSATKLLDECEQERKRRNVLELAKVDQEVRI